MTQLNTPLITKFINKLCLQRVFTIFWLMLQDKELISRQILLNSWWIHFGLIMLQSH